MNKHYDSIIIGGGHNGLTAATVLARKNQKVLLLEKRENLGGIAAGEEFHPGYRSVGVLHETATLRKQVVDALGLRDHGLDFLEERPAITLLAKNGQSVTLYADTEKTCASIAKVSQKDAAAYRKYRDFLDRIQGFVQDLLNNLPPDLVNLGATQLFQLAKKGWGLKRLGHKTMMEFLKVAPMSAWDYLDELFETDFLKAGIAGPAIYGSFTSARASYSNLNLLIWECTAKAYVPKGPDALVKALSAAAQQAGVEIVTGAEVSEIELDNALKVKGVRASNGESYDAPTVVSSCDPKTTFLHLLAPNKVEYALAHEIEQVRARGTTAKVNLALHEKIDFPGEGASFFRTGNSFIEMEKAFDPCKYRQFSEEPILDIYDASNGDPSLAPEGHQVLSILVHYAPYELDGGWTDAAKKGLLDNVINTLAQYCPGIEGSILGSEILSPVDLEERYGLPMGHIFHAEHAIDQLLTRPIPVCARYATPIHGLYLCGSGAFPGGGITGMPGFLAAKMVLN